MAAAATRTQRHDMHVSCPHCVVAVLVDGHRELRSTRKMTRTPACTPPATSPCMVQCITSAHLRGNGCSDRNAAPSHGEPSPCTMPGAAGMRVQAPAVAFCCCWTLVKTPTCGMKNWGVGRSSGRVAGWRFQQSATESGCATGAHHD